MTEENRFGRESYIRTVKLLAEELHEEVEKNGADPHEAASERVDSTDWIIYYYGCTKVLEHTTSPDAGDNTLDKLQISEAWGLGGLNSVLQLHAYCSMLEDVLSLYERGAQ